MLERSRISLIGLAAAAAAGCGGAEAADRARPNVILVTVDTLRQDYTSLDAPGGGRADATPFLAKLAERGTVFENAFAMSSWTAPSMNMILTGEARVQNDGAVLDDQDHIAEVFQRAGYRTAGFIGNPILFRENGFDRGCEVYDLVPVDGAAAITADEIVDDGLAWLDGLGEDEPFFLWLHPMDPHSPYRAGDGDPFELAPAPGLLEKTRATLPAERAERLTPEVWARLEDHRARYAGEVRSVDAAMERLWQGLEARGLDGDTIFVLTSDHGEGLWKRPTLEGEEVAARPFPPLYMLHGIQLHTEQVHVPLMFVGPGVDVGRREAGFVDLLDLAPSVCSLVDLGARHVMDGSPLFGDGARVPGDPLFSICARATTVTVDERWRLHVPSEHRARRFGDVPELYDLRSDPDERTPVGDPDRIAAMTGLIDDWREENRRVNDIREGSVRYYRALRALGYGGETSRSEEYDELLQELEAEGLLPEDGSLPGPAEIRAWRDLQRERGVEDGSR